MHNDLALDAHDLALDAQILSIFQIYSLLSFSISFFNLKKRKLTKESLSRLQCFEVC
jgi:hypothetical protein